MRGQTSSCGPLMNMTQEDNGQYPAKSLVDLHWHRLCSSSFAKRDRTTAITANFQMLPSAILEMQGCINESRVIKHFRGFSIIIMPTQQNHSGSRSACPPLNYPANVEHRPPSRSPQGQNLFVLPNAKTPACTNYVPTLCRNQHPCHCKEHHFRPGFSIWLSFCADFIH